MEWMSVKPSSQAFTTVLQRCCFPLKHKGSHRDEREAKLRRAKAFEENMGWKTSMAQLYSPKEQLAAAI